MGRIIEYFKRIQSGYRLVLSINTLSALGLGFASLYFKSQGLPLFKIVLVWAITPAVAMLTVLAFRTYRITRFMIIGSLCYTLEALVLIRYTDYSYVIFGICGGLAFGLLWVPLNLVFFSQSSRDNHAKDSSVYFLIGALLGIVLPPLGALIIDAFGFRGLFAVTVVLSMVPIVYIYKRISPQRIVAPFGQALRRYRGLKLIAAMEGALHFFRTFIKVYVLVFLITEFEIGAFSSYLAIISFIVSVMLARYSDRKQKRSELLTPYLFIMGGLIIALGLVTEPVWWFLLIGVYAFFDTATLPIRFALRMDYKEKDLGFWKVSEFFENLGRTVCLGVAGLCIYLHIVWLAFACFAALAFVYPYVLKRNTAQLARVG